MKPARQINRPEPMSGKDPHLRRPVWIKKAKEYLTGLFVDEENLVDLLQEEYEAGQLIEVEMRKAKRLGRIAGLE